MKNTRLKCWLKSLMHAKTPGIALMDVLFAMLILGIITAIMAPGLKYAFNKVNRFSTERILDKIEFGLSQYAIEMGGFPSKRDGNLTALFLPPEKKDQDWRGPYLDRQGLKIEENGSAGLEILDKWGNPIEYNRPPTHFGNKYKLYEIVSFGGNEDDPRGYIHKGQ